MFQSCGRFCGQLRGPPVLGTVTICNIVHSFVYFYLSLAEFGIHLIELTLDRNGPLPIRQLASVLLKQYVEAHWCQDSEKVSHYNIKLFLGQTVANYSSK